MRQDQTQSSALPGIGATLAAGFDLTTKHIWLLVFPVLLDLFYWLGPRLSFTNLFQNFIQLQQAQAADNPFLSDFSSQLLTDIPATNLYSMLSLPFIGVPTLMAGLPESSPLAPSVVEIQSWSSWLSFLVVLVVVGLLLTTLFFILVGRVAGKRVAAGVVSRGSETVVLPISLSAAETWDTTEIVSRLRHAWPRLLVLLFAAFLFLMALYIPASIVGVVAMAFVGPFGLVAVLLIVPFVATWLVLYLFFVPHGLTQNGRSLRRAVVESAKLVHSQLHVTITFLLSIWIINALVDMVLVLADDGSWFALIGILGHAFISTAMILATFIFYQARYTQLYPENY
ncbi:MAG: hypothetical protein AAF614_39775 [Chloroflexota bacterium]